MADTLETRQPNSVNALHICFVLPPIEYYSPSAGGAIALTAMNQARELLSRGYRVTVIAPQSENPTYDVGEVIPIFVGTRANLNPLQRAFSSRIYRRFFRSDWLYYEYYLRSLKRTFKQIQKQNAVPDAFIFFNDFQTPQLVRRLFPKSKLLLRLGNMVQTNAPNPSELLRTVDRIVTVTDFIRDWTLENYDLQPEKIVTATNGVDHEYFHPRDDFLDSPFLRGEGALRVLFVGRTDHSKGPDIVTAAAQTLQQEGREVHLTVAGATWFYDQGGPVDPFLLNLKEQLQAVGAEYLGHVARPDLPAVFQAADVVGVPTRLPEPLGNVAIEAMASGCAVIAARTGGLPEVCSDAAHLINPASPDEFTNVLRKLYDDRALLRESKQKAHARGREYSWPRNADIIEKALFG